MQMADLSGDVINSNFFWEQLENKIQSFPFSAEAGFSLGEWGGLSNFLSTRFFGSRSSLKTSIFWRQRRL